MFLTYFLLKRYSNYHKLYVTILETLRLLLLYLIIIFFFREECVHGKCVTNEPENCCICETGWSCESCDKCVPYWDCPETVEEACVNPNECLCTTPNLNDPKGLCQNPKLNPTVDEPIVTLKPCDPTKYNCNI